MKLDIKSKYYGVLVSYPWAVIIITLLIVAITWGVGLSVYPPSYLATCFEDPTLGIEARGTEISGKSRGMRNLDRAIGNDELTYVPNITLSPDGNPFMQKITEQSDGNSLSVCAETKIYSSHAKFVFNGLKDQNLLNTDDLHSICEAEDEYIRDYFQYPCQAHSIPFYVAELQGTSCSNITSNDLSDFVELLQDCYMFYAQGNLQEECNPLACAGVPNKCYRYNAVYKSFHYLLDVNFRDTLDSAEPVLKSTMLILQNSYSKSTIGNYYHTKIDGEDLETNDVQIAAMEIGYTYDLFLEYIIGDLYLFGIALLLIIVVMYLYLGSGLLVFATFMNVLFSFWVGYFVYHIIFRFEFFPFTNIMTLLLLIAIGADDIFIFHDSWQEAKVKYCSQSDTSQIIENDQLSTTQKEQSKSGDPSENVSIDTEASESSKILLVMAETFHHANKSILITSLTTSAAMFANFASKITMIRCFGIFTMTCIMINFLLMITWVPCLMVLKERSRACPSKCSWKWWSNLKQTVSKYIRKFYSQILPLFIAKARYVLIVVFTLAGFVGIVVVFITPKFQLPSTTYFPMFAGDHPFEVYNRDMRNSFEFSNMLLGSGDGMDVYFTWGIKAVDNGNLLNPFSNGYLEYEDSFLSTSSEAQSWMVNFCESLKNESFISDSMMGVECSYALHWEVLEDKCDYPLLNATIDPCCEEQTPVDSDLFSLCLPYCVVINGITYGASLGNHVFDKSNNVKAFSIKMSSAVHFSSVFNVMRDFYNELSEYMRNVLETAPEGLEEGWFYGPFEFYDLQAYLVQGTYISLGLSMAIALFFLLVTSLNVWISVYAIIVITFCISVVIASLVGQGWELNVVESAIVTLAVGLSIDFTIHYGVAYIQSAETQRADKVHEALTRVGSSVSMAACTTFLAGMALTPSRLIAYRQFGTFLMLVVVFSWLYATFLLLPVCYVIGPPLCQKQIEPDNDILDAYSNHVEFDLEHLPSDIPKKRTANQPEADEKQVTTNVKESNIEHSKILIINTEENDTYYSTHM